VRRVGGGCGGRCCGGVGRDEWIDAGVFEKLKNEALAAFDRASPKAAVAFRWTRLLSYDMQLLTFDMPAATLRLDQ
jgi:hypothetical protein